MNEKIKILVISDHPFAPSGVGTQTRYMVESLLVTGRYKFVCVAGAIKHEDYNPQKTEEWGDDLIIYPVDGYGNQDMIRSLVRTEKPDLLWFMTDPRFFGWLWEIENEIRPLVPMVYYHVWDNFPPPMYNKQFYQSTDVIVSISKLTNDIVGAVAPGVERHYLPHTVPTEVFKRATDSEILQHKERSFSNEIDPTSKTIFFWNGRNARRKQSGSTLVWFKEFLDQVGHDSACLIMHTDPKDSHGQDLERIIHDFGMTDGQILFSTEKIPPEALAAVYNISDCTINISDAEGFGLSALESLACETPIIVTMTGGLQEQVTDGEQWFGVGLEPTSKAVIGSQAVPYIYEDRVCKDDFINALLKIHNMSEAEKREMGKMGRSHVINNYGFDRYVEEWDLLLMDIHERYGSWENRKGYKTWDFTEVK